MFERFTERARQVVVLAQEEAVLDKCRYIGPEHILVGLVNEEEGLASRVLNHMGVDFATLREVVERSSQGPEPEEGDAPPKHTESAKKVFELALRQALHLGHNYIGTEHLLLGLIQSPNGQGNKALSILEGNFGLEAKDIRDEVIRALSGPKAPILEKNTPDSPTYKNMSGPVKQPALAHNTDYERELRDLLATAATLGRQFPERPAESIARAVVALEG